MERGKGFYILYLLLLGDSQPLSQSHLHLPEVTPRRSLLLSLGTEAYKGASLQDGRC